MKVIKYATSLILSIFVVSIASGQTMHIDFSPYESNFKKQIKVINNTLYVCHDNGLYYRNLNDDYSSWNHIFKGNAINDFVVSDNEILACTDYIYSNGKFLLRTSDGATDYEAYLPEDLEKCTAVISLFQNPSNSKELLAATSSGVYQSNDGGIEWKSICDYGIVKVAKHHPQDDNIIIFSYITDAFSLENSYFKISRDKGETWTSQTDDIGGFENASYITFSKENPDIICLSGNKIMKSDDKGVTWSATGSIGNYNGLCKIAFDERGSNRIFGVSDNNKLVYSENFGETWTDILTLDFFDNSIIADFTQCDNYIYVLSSSYKIIRVDLDKVDVSVSEIVPQQGIAMTVASNLLSFRSEENVMRVDIISADGNKMQSQEVNNNLGSIEISSLPAGTYIAVFTTSSGNKTRKFNR